MYRYKIQKKEIQRQMGLKVHKDISEEEERENVWQINVGHSIQRQIRKELEQVGFAKFLPPPHNFI